MPGRNGTGPAGQGSRTGRGMGNCKPSRVSVTQIPNDTDNRPLSRSGRGWGTWINNLFRRGRANRVNQK